MEYVLLDSKNNFLYKSKNYKDIFDFLKLKIVVDKNMIIKFNDEIISKDYEFHIDDFTLYVEAMYGTKERLPKIKVLSNKEKDK